MDLFAILDALLVESVEFIVIGGVAAALHGAPVTTYDLDVVHARSPENAERLARACERLDAWFRAHPARKPRPGRSDFQSSGHVLLMTKHGPLDLLGTVSGGFGYLELLPRSRSIAFGEGKTARVLDLDAVIDIKAATGRDKDTAALPLLRRTLEEQRRRE